MVDINAALRNSPTDLGFVSSSSVSTHTIHRSATSKTKRFIDLIGALIGLMIVLVLWIPIAIAISLDDAGPILYKQLRCGLNGKTFYIWKFRSMVVEAEQLKNLVKNEAQGFIFKNRNDPRVTRVGRFLRQTSLDELPQFWNVLRGEMSLVGTRPPTPEEVSNYEPHHFQRLYVIPGMTGEWQVNGRSHISSFEDIVKMDLAYQEKWSIRYDIKLILQTLITVFKRKGAY
ncbi:sugar transferase [Leptolyngbya sp. AN02str]|uniref:sugar transferase n=1 Tax=Leptolyngbya sp. AN02str TaxID=3423363 RepID=UPI003D3205BC